MTKFKKSIKTLCAALAIGGTPIAIQADVIGKFDHTRNLPGFLDIDGRSAVSKPNVREHRYFDGVERGTPSQILKKFLTRDKKLDETVVHEFLKRVKDYEDNAFLTFCTEDLPEEVSGDHNYCKTINYQDKDAQNEHMKKFLKKWHKNESYIGCELARKQMEKALELAKTVDFNNINAPENQKFIEHFFEGFELLEYMRAEDSAWGRTSGQTKYYWGLFKAFFSDHSIKKGRVEAANLPVPEDLKDRFPNQLFLSPEQVKKLDKEGYPIEAIDPMDSGFWRKPLQSPSVWDPQTFNGGVNEALTNKFTEEEIKDLMDPDKEIVTTFVYDTRLHGQSPKIKVKYGKEGEKLKMKMLTDKGGAIPLLNTADEFYRIFVGSEVNIQPAVNNFAAMLGFTTDPTYFKRKVRVYMPKEVYEKNDFDRYLEEDVIKRLSKHYKKSWNLRSAFNVKIDETGKKYLQFHSVSFQRKNDAKSDINLNLFVRHGLGKSLKREFRAFALFLALIFDPDTKDDNAGVKLVAYHKHKKGEQEQKGEKHGDKDIKNGKEKLDYKVAFSAKDMGIALGLGIPNFYQKDIIKKVTHNLRREIDGFSLNYNSFFASPIFESTSFSDARWLMRMVAQIPKEKLVETLYYSGYPKLVAEYYAEVFLRRADQLYEVLGMEGKSYTSFTGEKFKITKKSQIVNPDSFAIKGQEKFFKHGLIYDPKNELFDPKRDPFPRDWGTTLDKSTDGRHKEGLYRLLTKGLLLESGNLGQKEMLKYMQFNNFLTAHPFCKDRCFYAGFLFGVDWFIPMRFVVDNPTESAKEYPYWVIDMFRLAFSIGDGTESVVSKLGLEISKEILKVGGQYSQGYDFIRIRPVRDYAAAVGSLNKHKTTPEKFSLMKDLKAQIVEQMEEGDILLTSSFLSLLGSLLLDPFSLTDPGSGGAEVGVRTYYSNRLYLMKGKENHYLANWADIRKLNLFTDAYLRSFFFRIPLMKMDFEKSNEHGRVYQFDFNNPEQKQTLLTHLHRTNPTDINPNYRYQDKEVDYRGKKYSLNLFSLLSVDKLRGKVEVKAENFETKEQVDELIYEQQQNLKMFTRLDLIDVVKMKIKAEMDKDGKIFTNIHFKFNLNEAYRKDFIRIHEYFKTLLPDDFVVFDPNAVKYYLGKFDLHSTIVINNEGIDKLFGKNSLSKPDMCLQYAKVHGEVDGNAWCSSVLSHMPVVGEKLHARRFLRDYDVVREEFNAPGARSTLSDSTKAKSYSLLRKIVNLLSNNRGGKRVVDVLQTVVDTNQIYRHATMTSFLEGFPGGTLSVENGSKSKGELKPDKKQLSQSVPEVFKIFTDKIDYALRHQKIMEPSTPSGF